MKPLTIGDFQDPTVYLPEVILGICIIRFSYPLVNEHNYGNSPCLIVNSTINGQFSIAMLKYQRSIHNSHGICELGVFTI